MIAEPIIHPDGSGLAFLTVSAAEGAAVVFESSKDMFAKPDANAKTVPLEGYRGYIPWGASDDTPQTVITKVGKSPDLSTNLLFNIKAGYGNGIMAARKTVVKNKLVYTPVIDNKDINEFFRNNDIDGFLNEQLVDLNYFYNTFAEIILSKDKSRVVELTHKEASFSRFEEMNPDTGKIENHFYSAKFYSNETPAATDIVATPVLDRKNPTLDLLRRIGREPDAKTGRIKEEKKFRYIIAGGFPSPGRFYYQKPQWYSLFESGWYDFALLIPELKKALLNNQMTIKYMVYINERYFPAIFAEEGLATKKEMSDRIKKEYDNIQNFLSGAKNTGKATISKIKYTPDGKEEPMIRIVPIENHFKGGEYIEDSEEVSNILGYGTGVHSSIIGSHGKSKTINGTEARELFIIQQSMMKPFRDRLLKPLYVVKAVNGWPEDIDFVIPNMELTTLDKNSSGATSTTGGQEI